MKITRRNIFWFKVVIHLMALTPIIYLVLLVLSNSAGGDPVQYIIHYTGIGALNTLVMMLLISPIARRFKLGPIVQTRRLVGLYVFAYASLHLMAFISLDLLFEWSLLWQETIKRPYILIGMFSYLILFALAITSLPALRHKMGRQWQTLHRLVYLATALIPIHFYWSVKSEIIEPSIYIAIAVILLLIRAPLKRLLSKNILM